MPWRVIAKEHILPLECEAVVSNVHSLPRLEKAHGRRHFIFSASLGWACVGAKGRSSIWSGRRCCLEMRCLNGFRRPWQIPSEVNLGEAPWRRFVESSPERGLIHKQTHSFGTTDDSFLSRPRSTGTGKSSTIRWMRGIC